MLPQHLLPNSTATPVAKLLIDGLAVCCFDRRVLSARHWEVAFMRDSGHHFEIGVTEKTLEGSVVIAHDPYTVPDSLVTLDITVDNGSNDHYSQYEEGYYCTDSTFDRDVSHNHNDFRWVVDFIGHEVRHGEFDGLKPKSAYPDRADVTLLSVPNSLCYTEKLNTSPVIILPRALNDPCEGTVFGHTNEQVGMIVSAETPGKIKIKGRHRDGTMIIIKDLAYKAGQFYEIVFTNMDIVKRQAVLENTGKRADNMNDRSVKNYERGDFEYFYNLIGVTGEEKALWGDKSVHHGRLGDCHAVMVNSTIQTLEPLLE